MQNSLMQYTVAGEDLNAPIYGPTMTIAATGEECPVLSRTGHIFTLQTVAGPAEYHRKDLEFTD